MRFLGTPRGLGRRGVLAGAGLMLASPAIVRAQGAGGAALVIGNSKYHWEAALPNVKRDAPDVARAFQGMGLKTELVQDADRATMDRAIESFKASARGANLAAFYFAGHGAAWENRTYLVPVDADLSNPSTVKSLIPTQAAGGSMKEAQHRLIVFDNCRNNPADGWRQVAAERGAVISTDRARAAFEANNNALVLFSTAPGRVAVDGPAGQNSPFAAAFLHQLSSPSVDLQSISSKIRRELLIATEGRQVLFDRNAYKEPFVVKGSGQTVAASGAGWGGDPSRIIELTNAYAYAHEYGLPLPSGLIAHRPTAKSADAVKVGSYKFEQNSPALGLQPGLMVIMSVEEKQSAEIIWSSKGSFNSKTGKMEGGSIWRFITGSLASGRLEFVPREEASRYTFNWSDANSGRFSQLQETSVGGNNKNVGGGSASFTRLDG